MIDQDRLSELEHDFGADELGEIIAVFLAEAGEAVDALGATGPDDGRWRERLHFLKGCARTVGAVRLGDLCERMERAASFGPGDLRSLRREFRSLRDAFGGRPLRQAG